MKVKSNIAFASVAIIIAIGAYGAGYQQAKIYPVNHTEAQWVGKIQGKGFIQQVIHQSNLPAREAFICDSVLQEDIVDIQRQVGGAMAADTLRKKIEKPK